MSAFVVSPNHIFSLIRTMDSLGPKGRTIYTDKGQYNPGIPDDQKTMAQILYDQNLRSVCHRYREEMIPEPIRVTQGRVLTPVEAIKACDCYDYQACETDDYEKSVAAQIVHKIRITAIDSLPGYDEAPWCIE